MPILGANEAGTLVEMMSETMLFPRCVQVCVVVPLLRILLFSFSLCVCVCVCVHSVDAEFASVEGGFWR